MKWTIPLTVIAVAFPAFAIPAPPDGGANGVLRPIDINIPRPRPVRPAPPSGGHQKRQDFEFENDMEEIYEDTLEGEMESQLRAYSHGVQFHPAQPYYGFTPPAIEEEIYIPECRPGKFPYLMQLLP
ncbi:hypothetical protein K440DRAFT_640506 [Wilcoxina mikolae CBS 423.85]|nr:hypothetical protein K440DRAFT_640506 [Wilcoxina mikolae CBS 423.85]